LVWRSWDEREQVVYHTGSGETHLLNEVAAKVLRQLEVEPLGVGELADRLAESLEIEATADVTRVVGDLVHQFDDLGLIEPTT
jgi:PqqD family protein of HPr-rel-A system